MEAEEDAGSNESLLLEVIQSGKARLAWARFETEPWWPSLAMNEPAWDTLRTFTKVAQDEPTGDVEKGKTLVFFLGESSYEVIEKGQVTKHFYDRKPSSKEMVSNAGYREAVELSDRLVCALEAGEKPDINKLRDALKSGEASLIWAYTETVWWPAVRFTSLESAQGTGAEISVGRKVLKEDHTLVFRLGGLANSWQVVKRWVPYEEKRHQKNTSNAMDKSFCLDPDSDRSLKQATAVTEAESLRHFLRTGGGEASSSGKRDFDAEYSSAEEEREEGGKKAKTRAEGGVGSGYGGGGGAAAGAATDRKRGRRSGQQAQGGANGRGLAALPALKYMGRQRKRKKLTPEEVRKIKRLAEGLMYMAAVQDTPELMGDLTELRDSLSQKRRGTVDRSTLESLKSGLESYAKKMRHQLSEGERALRRYQANVEEAANEYQNVCIALHKDLGKVTTTMSEQRDRLAEQVRGWSGKKGFSMALKEEGQTLGKLVTIMQGLEDLKALVKEPRSIKQRMADSLIDHAKVAFKIGEELTEDQVAAAEQLQRTCADFMARLDREPTQPFF